MNHWYRKQKLFENEIVVVGDTSNVIKWHPYSFCSISLLSNKNCVIAIEYNVDDRWILFDSIELIEGNDFIYRFSHICGKFMRLKKTFGDNCSLNVLVELKN